MDISKKEFVIMGTVTEGIYRFLNGILFCFWGVNTVEVVKNIISKNIFANPFNEFISFSFSFVGLCFFLFRLYATIRMHILDHKIKSQELREKEIMNNQLEDKK
jgi:hypothetical protein